MHVALPLITNLRYSPYVTSLLPHNVYSPQACIALTFTVIPTEATCTATCAGSWIQGPSILTGPTTSCKLPKVTNRLNQVMSSQNKTLEYSKCHHKLPAWAHALHYIYSLSTGISVKGVFQLQWPIFTKLEIPSAFLHRDIYSRHLVCNFVHKENDMGGNAIMHFLVLKGLIFFNWFCTKHMISSYFTPLLWCSS